MTQPVIRIVYPIKGGTYPVVKSDSLASSAYFTVSFSITAAGGPHKIKWGFNGNPIGGAAFFDQFSAQFTWELPAGEHLLNILCSTGSKEAVNFIIA